MTVRSRASAAGWKKYDLRVTQDRRTAFTCGR